MRRRRLADNNDGPPPWPADTYDLDFVRLLDRDRTSRSSHSRIPEHIVHAGHGEPGDCRIGAGHVLHSIVRRIRPCRHGRALPVGAPDYMLLRSNLPGFDDNSPSLFQSSQDCGVRRGGGDGLFRDCLERTCSLLRSLLGVDVIDDDQTLGHEIRDDEKTSLRYFPDSLLICTTVLR